MKGLGNPAILSASVPPAMPNSGVAASVFTPLEFTPPPPPPLPAAAPPPPPPVEELDVGATAGWVVIGAGGAALVTGALFGWRASSNHDAAVNEPVQARAADLQDTANQDATLANVMLAVGGAIVISGGIYELLHQRAQHEGAQVSITPRSISVGWAW